MSIRARLLFDLDGTISDPVLGIVRSLNHALVHFGQPAREEADLHVHIGPPLDEAFRALTGASSPGAIAPYVAKYRERYFAVGYRENVLYQGIIEALGVLDSSRIPMGVCTSKRTDIAERILEMFGVRRFFQFVDGGDAGVRKWQQIEGLRSQGFVDQTTIMIGDRAVDIEAAHRNGLQGAGVLWGYGSRQEIESAHPEHVLSVPADLQKLVVDREEKRGWRTTAPGLRVNL